MNLNLNADDLKNILGFIYRHKGIDLSSYRQNFILRRLSFRMNAAGLKSGWEYINFIKKNNDELSRLLDALAINVTEFFRDPEVFAVFRDTVLNEIISRKASIGHKVIRAWSAGCASGEEPYSLAILINEELSARHCDFVVRIWGTDIDKEALSQAKKAEYSRNSLKALSKEQLEKYFISVDSDTYKLKKEIKELVDFRPHNLLSDPPLKFMDIIFCRNVMIYLTQKEHGVLFKKFNQALNSKGYLVIGKVESIWNNLKDLFAAVDTRQKIYKKTG